MQEPELMFQSQIGLVSAIPASLPLNCVFLSGYPGPQLYVRQSLSQPQPQPQPQGSIQSKL